MKTLTQVPLRTVHAYETGEETVVELELPEHRKLSLAFDDRTMTVRIAREEPARRWPMHADVTGA